MKTPKLSVVIPAFNEATRLKNTLPQIINFFKNQKYSSEIIIVDDGSTDHTKDVVESFKEHPDLQLLSLPENSGKGAAVRKGVLGSSGKFVLFMDADLSTPLTELESFWDHKSYPIVIGSRKIQGASITQHQSLIRENLGKIFTWLSNIIATKNVADITCGFKFFTGDIARNLFQVSQLNDWSFDAEILFIAQKWKLKIKEIPVQWQNDPRTKVNLIKAGIGSFMGLIHIRLNDLRGKYPSSLSDERSNRSAVKSRGIKRRI